ncbi:MAG: 30S ribosomal protein S8 [Clostridiales bacterium]|nr:30S ribosomal protein S8 [Clostridiales bacterium]
MTMTDPIADMLTRVRNANAVKHKTVDIPNSNLKREIATIMLNEGFIKGFDVMEDGKQGILRIQLKYGKNKEKVLTGIKKITKPGLRVYAKKTEVPRVLGGLGMAIISTSKGLVTDKTARKEGVGGEVIAYIW